MIIFYILGTFVVIRLLILSWSVKCPHCNHRTFKEPLDTYFVKALHFRIKTQVYYCEHCKQKFKHESL